MESMNANPVSSSDCMKENGHGSDTDSDLDESPDYYQPISSTGDEDSGSDTDQANSGGRAESSQGYASNVTAHLPNGYANGLASLSLRNDVEEKSSEDEDEEERAREASDLAMRRAFSEDESRRNAPLRPEAAVRVMEAMRGVSFGGSAPGWAESMPEGQWIERLRTLRRPSDNTN